VQRSEASLGREYPFVHNSIAVSVCGAGGRWSRKNYWGRGADDTPRAFFEPDRDAEWARQVVQETGTPPYYWPLDGFLAHDVLFVSLLRVAASEPRGPLNLPFRLLGVDLARIENFRDSPEDWNVRISTLSEDLTAFPGSAFVTSGEFVYAIAFLDAEAKRSGRILTRIERAALAEWKPSLVDDLESLSEQSAWRPGIASKGAQIVMDDAATEMSVHFDPAKNLWIAVYGHPEPGAEGRISASVWVRRAATLEGPWSAPRELFVFPEMAPRSEESRDDPLFCYAAKAHPQFSEPSSLLVTYVCSLYAKNQHEGLAVMHRLRESPELYRARAISVPIPCPAAEGPETK